MLLLTRRRFRPRGYIASDILATQPAALISYLKLDEPSGATAEDSTANNRDGAYVGVDLAQPGIGDGRTAPFFDGTNDYVNWYSAGLNAAFNGAEGTFGIWIKMASAAVWPDGTARRPVTVRVNTSNSVHMQKPAAGTLNVIYAAGGTTKTIQIDTTTTDWFSVYITWSAAADEMKVYFNGTQYGTTQTGLGIWAGALAATACVIGAQTTTPANVHHGWLAHAALWSAPLTASEIAYLGRR